MPGRGSHLGGGLLRLDQPYESGGFLWRYDSARKPEADQSPIADFFKKIIAAKIRYFLNANDQVERMEGADELVNRLNALEGAKLKSGKTWDDKALDKVLTRMISGTQQPLEVILSGLRIMYSKDFFKNRIDSSFLPGNAVQPGDTWNYSRESHRHSLFNVGIMRDCTVTFQGWEMRGERICSRLEFRGTERTNLPSHAEAAIPITEGTFSGVVWFDPESGRGVEVNSSSDFKVTRKGRTAILPYPAGADPARVFTDHHHQIITEKLISVKGLGDLS